MAKMRHIALFKFKASVSAAEIEKALDSIRRLTKSLPGIEEYVAGTNQSRAPSTVSYTHGFVMTFKDRAALDAYLPHPEHQRVAGTLGSLVEAADIFDVEG